MAVRSNLAQFARSIRKRAVGVEPAVSDVLRRVALVANQAIVMATPVDTGRARANWQVSIDTEITTETGSTNFQAQMAANQNTIKSYKNGALIIQNNVPYISKLNAGSSAQAPAGFVQRALQAAARAVAKAKVVR